MKKIKELIELYGPVAIGTWLAIFGLVWLAFGAAITLGLQPESAAGGTGTVLAAYVATQATKPLRIVATLALTPLVARVVRRRSPTAAVAAVAEGKGAQAAPEA